MAILRDTRVSDTLVVAFTGFAGKLHLPVSQFFVESGLIGASKIAIYDRSHLKTLGGLAPHYASFEGFLAALKREIEQTPHERLMFVGTSGGGHSALLYAHLLKAQKAVVFSCYPYLSIAAAKRENNPELVTMKRLLHQFDQLPAAVKKYLDLRDVLEQWNGVTEYEVHVSKYNEWDNKRALYLEGMPHLRIHQHPYSAHGLVAELLRADTLKACFL